ncbi:MAG: RNA 3'-terminal phosphate cyclase [Candidatus Aenigmarchaeota archaeon]|nr:RNA 3'-terminal phosphate cyclase [Candidatus Aenigmarchaeota archaeon]
MIELDGAIGYGQVLRTAIALSALTLQPIRVFNIRINRPNPGLRPQHLTGVLEAAKLCHAEVKNAKIGSTEITFIPKRLDIPNRIIIDIKTAGSVTLLLQTILPIVIFSNKKVSITIFGGTDVPGSPTINYYKKVFAYYLEKFGVILKINVERYGFYPKGGGKVNIEVNGVKNLNSVSFVEKGELREISGFSIASKELQKARVAERQIAGLESVLEKINGSYQYVDTLSIGTSLLAIAEYENCILGKDGLGEKGKRAEDVGREVGLELKKSIESNACLDKFMADQILIFAALARGSSEFTIEEFTDHVNTNMITCEKLLNVKFEKEGNKVKVDGIGFSL